MLLHNLSDQPFSNVFSFVRDMNFELVLLISSLICGAVTVLTGDNDVYCLLFLVTFFPTFFDDHNSRFSLVSLRHSELFYKATI